MDITNRSIFSRLLAAWLGALLIASPFAGLAASAAQSGTSAAGAARQYRVARGDSLTSVARKFGLSVSALAAANGLASDAELLAGATLSIPGGTAAASAPAASAAPVRYRVRSGDTLSSIAGQFNVSVQALRSWNNLSSSRILVGQQLIVNSAGARTAARSATRAARPAVARVSTFADSTAGDVAGYDDPVVREAAVAGLGRYNGSVVAIDPNSGRILSIVNQKLAFSAGFIPCSTIKPVIAIAALEESVIRRDTMIPVGRRSYMNLVEAMARSNNTFFEELGRRLGFETVARYARLLGLGELAGYNLPEEQPGAFPSEPPARGGVARMSSFGEGIQMTPLQLASLISTLANGGTMYYLQYPRTEEEKENFAPRIKRRLDINPLLPDVRDGMLAAVLYGTGRQSYSGEGEQPLGKTGTCSDAASRLGWFVSYADSSSPKIVLAVLMRGRRGSSVTGPLAALIAGRIYRRLYEENYFADRSQPASPRVSPISNSGN
jgi:LysM repeat protein/beta-lactamase class D